MIVPVQLAAQARHMHFHAIGARIKVQLPHSTQQFGATERLPGMARKMDQQRIFAGKQGYGPPASLDPALQQINDKIPQDQFSVLPLGQTDDTRRRFRFMHPWANHVLCAAVERLCAGERIVGPLPQDHGVARTDMGLAGRVSHRQIDAPRAQCARDGSEIASHTMTFHAPAHIRPVV